MLIRKNIFFFAILFTILSCQDEGKQTVSEKEQKEDHIFCELSSGSTGIDFANPINEDLEKNYTLLKYEYLYNGAGVAIGDINNDGLPDIYFSGNMVDDRLYLNKGGFQFEDISEKAGIHTGSSWSTGVNMVDINQDGLLDIYVCKAGPDNNEQDRKNLCFINKGDLTFEEKAEEMGLQDKGIGVQSVFFDMDKDGDLDCYVSNESPNSDWFFESLYRLNGDKDEVYNNSGHLYRNDGNNKFTDITEEAGLMRVGFGLGVVATDINNDGWTDLYIANDYSIPDFIYINQKDGTFSDEVKKRTRQIPYFSMGVDVNDINNDGYPDIASLDMATQDHVRGKTAMVSMDVPKFRRMTERLGYAHAYMFNALQLNTGKNEFVNIANLAGVSKTEWSWSALLFDMDNDGWKDLFISNGYVKNTMSRDEMRKITMAAKDKSIPDEQKDKILFEGYKTLPSIHVPNEFYLNSRDLVFNKSNTYDGAENPSFSNGAAYGDLNNDGKLDLVINNINEPAIILKNCGEKNSHYIQCRLTADFPVENSKVYLAFDDGTVQFNERTNVRGYQSCMDSKIHFGLSDENADKVDYLEVHWSDGSISVIEDPVLDTILEIQPEKANLVANSKLKERDNSRLLEEVDPETFKLDYSHKENNYDDFRKEGLLPQKQSTQGPHIKVADLNGDGMKDIVIPGPAKQASVIYFQSGSGAFEKLTLEKMLDPGKEHVDVECFDADGDGDMDLYFIAGGNEFPENDPRYEDDILINNGDKTFSRKPAGGRKTSNSVARTNDIDGDGDLDIFVGGRLIPQKYPTSASSYLLINENNNFSVHQTLDIGMINDAVWTDYDGDGAMDLIAVGEWEYPVFMKLKDGKLEPDNSFDYLKDIKGWFFHIREWDIDMDGDMDYVVGNLGSNTKFSASPEKPLMIYGGDFDNNGTFDCVLGKKYKGKLVPTRGKECSSEQMPVINQKFPTFEAFANAELKEILGEEMENSLQKKVTEFRSGVLVNTGEKGKPFEFRVLDNKAQIAPVIDTEMIDIDGDNNQEMVIVGNIYNTEVETPRYDAGSGLVIKSGKGDLICKNYSETGLYAPNNAKSIAEIEIGEDKYLIVGNNNGKLQLFRVNGI